MFYTICVCRFIRATVFLMRNSREEKSWIDDRAIGTLRRVCPFPFSFFSFLLFQSPRDKRKARSRGASHSTIRQDNLMAEFGDVELLLFIECHIIDLVPNKDVLWKARKFWAKSAVLGYVGRVAIARSDSAIPRSHREG